MAIKWQEILKWGSGGTISVFVLLALIVNLSGISNVSHSGDITCLEECESYINFTSTYWEFCFEKGGDKGLIYKKQARSRRLWINMDKIDYLVPTEPKAEITLQVPTYGRKWRDIKEKDCLRRTTKANPLPIRLKIIGTKQTEQTIKWGFELDHWTSERVYIDPLWKGINITKLCEWKTIQEDVFDYVTYEYTCPTNYFKIYQELNYTECFNKNVWNETNQTWNYEELLYGHSYDYGYKSNKTIYWIKNEKTGTKDVDVCDKIVGYKINNKIINFSTCGIYCARNGTTISCDMCPGEDGVVDANCDGILKSGESGFKFDIKNVNWHNIKIKADSPKFRKLKECVIKDE